jgi:UDP-4-keto-6-deoxy-N-acetylglucosamine 4-aminotransferase
MNVINHIIPYGRQYITDEDIQAVVETLKSDYLTQGPQIDAFEAAFARYVGSQYAVAVSNGTAALHISVLTLGLKPGDKVITTPITFSASANCVRYCGAEVLFADIDPNTYLIDLVQVKQLLESHPKGSIKGIIPVDMAGNVVNTKALRNLVEPYGCWILEDACHAPGGYFTDTTGIHQLAGNNRFSDVTVFSFHPVKHIACGEGGMVTTNDVALYKQLLRLRSHGITKGDDTYTNPMDLASAIQGATEYPGWYMEMQQLGYNYRLTDIQAALGLSQLKRVDQGLARRRELAATYATAFQGKSYLIGQSGNVEGHAYHLYIIEVNDRLGLYNHLRTHGIFAQIHYIPVHLMPYYQQQGWKQGDLPAAETYYSRCISIPMYPTLADEEQQYVIQTINEYYG